MINKVLKKIRMEILFLKFILKYKPNLKKRLSLMGPEYIELGKNVTIGKFWRIENYSTYGKDKFSPSIKIGCNNYIGSFFTILNGCSVLIGDNNLIASHVLITTINHGMNIDNSVFSTQSISVKPVKIGNNCWIGEKVVILPGITIGDNCVIGAGSVVTHNIISNTISAGNPAKVIKKWNFDSNCWESVL